MKPSKRAYGANVKEFLGTAMLVGAGVTALAFFASLATTGVGAQVGTGRPPEISPQSYMQELGHDPARLAVYTPDPVKFPVPRTKWDGKPDFSGVYWARVYVSGLSGHVGNGPTSLDVLDSLTRPEAWAARANVDTEDSPRQHCWPENPPHASMHPMLAWQIVSAPGFVAIVNGYGGTYRIIPTDGRPSKPSPKPTFQGDSVGHWDGDTLVVHVTNFRVRENIGSHYQDKWSDALHIVERWTRPDAQILEYESWIEDPKTLTGPWTAPKIRKGRAMSERVVQEDLCISEATLQHINSQQEEYAAKGFRKRPVVGPNGKGGRNPTFVGIHGY